MEDKNMNEIMKEIKAIDGNVTSVLIPILKDTIADYRKIVFKLIVVIVILIAGIIGISIYSQITISKQTNKFNEFSDKMLNKYNEFLSQFEYETEDTVYQDLDSTGDSDLTVNSGITFTR